MALKSDLESDIGNVFSQSWEETVGRVVPVPNDVGLNNKVVFLENAVVLYADLDGSTKMVAENKWEFSAEIYKSFLLSAAKIIKSENGAITSYDGDRIMAIFIGAEKYDRAVRSALKIRWVVLNMIQPRMQKSWSTEFKVKHTVGIDASNLSAYSYPKVPLIITAKKPPITISKRPRITVAKKPLPILNQTVAVLYG